MRGVVSMNLFRLYTLIDVISLILIYFVYLVPKWRKNTYQLFVKTCLYIYLSFVMYFTLIIPIIIPLPFINMNPSNITMNLVPFYDILSGNGSAIIETALNILMFIPFGIMYPFIYHKPFKKTICTGLYLTLSIEIWQLISARNLSSCDITDVINNLIGAILGYGIYFVLSNPVDKLLKVFFKSKQKSGYSVSKKFKIIIFVILIIQLLIRSFIVNQF